MRPEQSAGHPDRVLRVSPHAVAVREGKQATRWLLGHRVPLAVVSRAARRGDPLGRIFVDPEVRRAPHEFYDRVRADGALQPTAFGLTTASWSVCRDVLRDDRMLVGSPAGGLLEKLLARAGDPWALGPADAPSMLATNAPQHTRYRTLVSKAFTARAVARLREQTEEVTEALLDDLAAGPGDRDLVSSYAAMLPVTVICAILGVPLSERDLILRLGEGAAASLDMGLPWRDFRRVQSSLREFNTWIDGRLREVRSNPGDDLLSALATAEDGPDRLTDVEVRSIAGLLLVAGFETTVNLISAGAHLLLRHPKQLAILRAEPGLWPNAVDEILRLEPPVVATGRYAAEPMTVAGVDIPRHVGVTTLLAAANRDPDVFERPHEFDVRRANARDHLAFSGGRHFCLGAALARQEGEVALSRLFARFPALAPAGEPRLRPTHLLHGYQHLPVALGRVRDVAAV